jgi:hypothetical protein
MKFMVGKITVDKMPVEIISRQDSLDTVCRQNDCKQNVCRLNVGRWNFCRQNDIVPLKRDLEEIC